jgi:hypothetical protein
MGRPRHRWEDNIRMDVRDLVLGNSIGFTLLSVMTGGGFP